MKNIGVIVLTAACLITTVAAHAKEGFSISAESLPAGIQSAWISTFLVFAGPNGSPGDTGDMGSAFVVRTTQTPSGQRILLLTNTHVLNDLCKGLGPCAGLTLFHDMVFSNSTSSFIKQGTFDFMTGSVNVLAISKNPDLALLSIDSNTFLSTEGAVRPLKFKSLAPVVCKPLGYRLAYLIGFPATGLRTNSKSAPIEEKEADYKRWSSGYALDNQTTIASVNGLVSYLVTTIDSLPGNSGGPIVDPDGNLAGVLVASDSVESNGFAYGGGEQQVTPSESLSSMVIPCELVRDFLSKFSKP